MKQILFKRQNKVRKSPYLFKNPGSTLREQKPLGRACEIDNGAVVDQIAIVGWPSILKLTSTHLYHE